MYIPDPIEQMENMAEKWANEHIKGDVFKCNCGKMCKLNDGQPISNNPYAPPVCMDCFGEWLNLQEKNNG